MVTNPLLDAIAAIEPSLVKGTNLFAENASGSKSVVLYTRSGGQLAQIRSGIQWAIIESVVSGFNIAEGFRLSRQVVKALEDVVGDFTYGTEQYHIYAINPMTIPVLFKDGETMFYATSFKVSYRVAYI